MSTLPDNATAAEIVEEIDFVNIMIETLDHDGDDYQSRRHELEEQRQNLQDRLAHTPHHSSPNLPSPNQTPPNPTSSSSSMKRSAVQSDDRPHKRQTPSPLPGSDTAATRMRQLQAEAVYKRQRQQSMLDEELARKISQESAVPGPSSQRPQLQAILGHDGRYLAPPRSVYGPVVDEESSTQPRIKSENVNSIPHRARDIGTELVDLTGDSDDDQNTIPKPSTLSYTPSTPLHRGQFPPTPRTHSQSKPFTTSSHSSGVPSMVQQNGNPGSYQPYTPYQMPGAYPTPVYAQPGNAYSGHIGSNSATYNSASSSMPSFTDGYNAYGALSNHQGAPSHFAPKQHIHNTNMARLSALHHQMTAANNVQNTNLFQLNNLINGSRNNPFHVRDGYGNDSDDDEVSFIGSTRRAINPYAGQADLFKERYEAIESYNPEKTREEINALLMNIRPDEELPDHLLVSTPEALSIKLHKYQELGLTWLQKSEEGTNKGGILADDMGLGKTIQMLSLIVTNKSTNPRQKTTLIVAPVALLRQWKQEIQQKLKPGRHALTIYTHHGVAKKASFKDLSLYDVVLTTFGSLAAEFRRYEKFELRKHNDPDARPRKDEQCSLIGQDCRWYRVILDEAQCIKNKSTLTAKAVYLLSAQYRFCMTGTPMMNNVDELYSLIKFLRIRPYNSWEKFRSEFSLPLKSNREESREGAMTKLQALCRATMLRRTKKSEYQGKPILELPERSTEIDHAVFDEDEQALYTALETKSQITFNKYLKAGTVGRSYSAILVLLLRLRQACCHPHLIKDFSIAAAADLTTDDLFDLASELTPAVVNRIKSTDGNFECPICMDACLNPAIFLPCGHDTCRDCYVKLADPSTALREGNEAGTARCPHCRGNIDPKRITDFTSFKRAWWPELLTEEEKNDFGTNEDSETESEDSDTDSEGNDLNGFIVTDDVEDGETESEAEEAGAEEFVESSKKNKKSKKSKKAKGKAKVKTAGKLTLAELKKRANTNVKARKKYLRKLREDYHDSAKIRKMMDLLRDIMEGEHASGEKVLVFSQWTSLLDLCEVEIDRQQWEYRRYDGSMNAKLRGDAVDDFKDAKQNVRIMLVSLKAGNAGLNLNIANQVIILDPFWNPYIEEQAIDRAHRFGQTRAVKVHRVLVQDTVEDRIIALQETKRKIIETALDEKQASQLSRLGARELAYLFGVTRNITDPVNYAEAGR